ncbi:MAG: hypothetical protein ACIAXF_07035 [Phycisphaerales bacterium JB063]
MSYDLWFWKQKPDCVDQPGSIVTAIAQDGDYGSVCEIDMDSLLGAVILKFPAIEQHANPQTGKLRQLILDPKDQDWMLLVGWPSHHLEVESHGAPGEILNVFIDICWEYECPLYDPQTGTRYTG